LEVNVDTEDMFSVGSGAPVSRRFNYGSTPVSTRFDIDVTEHQLTVAYRDDNLKEITRVFQPTYDITPHESARVALVPFIKVRAAERGDYILRTYIEKYLDRHFVSFEEN
jgi:hypothetical protein